MLAGNYTIVSVEGCMRGGGQALAEHVLAHDIITSGEMEQYGRSLREHHY